ncbi:Spy/CpxP family protein refolding chaperone [Hyphomicrobium sp.]|uniref:Spy/CpxP family protein refolding chaperone n=1 Tax=Hyphomicrobium sp. TaxID=82 RepID=UPI002E3519AD|nr:Spy/CpxP family protein refolding chaperone [Hyphomicrobium sp.]HEX2839838.1 Spy/CpxP family protein refolding chaperone [Hyphomicrobium sp.]
MRRVVPPLRPGHLFPLKDVLNISDRQLAQWAKFQATIDAAIRVMPSGARQSDPLHEQYPSLPNAIDDELRGHVVRAEACRALKERAAELYDVLSDQQRLLANRLLVPLVSSVMASGHASSARSEDGRQARSRSA